MLEIHTSVNKHQEYRNGKADITNMIKVSKTNAIKAFVCTTMVLSLGFSTFGAPYGYAAEAKPATTKEQSVQKKR